MTLERKSAGLQLRHGQVLLLDQQRLPMEERWLDASQPQDMVDHIKALRVRGAPLIGVAAASSLAWLARSGASEASVRQAAAALRAARPTAVNLMWAIDRLLNTLDQHGMDALITDAEAIFDEDVQLCDQLATHGAALVQDGEGLLTHCNAGGLATAGIGTAVGVILRAHALGKRIHVFVDETRPLLQGGRLTAYELLKAGVPHTLITDSMAAIVMRDGRVQRVLVGADRVARNGDFANKVGTYGVAVSAHHHRVPFHPVAPRTTVDVACPTGAHIPIEQRDGAEVRGALGSFGQVQWALTDSPVFNPAFDVTPVSLVTSLVTDAGVFTRSQLLEDRLASL